MTRVRFAPAPTGMMHMGNARTALMNYLYARHKNGIFVLRIEDTDPERNFDPNGKIIQEDLKWLGITTDEGPLIGGPHTPYIQSERTDFYNKIRQELEKAEKIYRCFCDSELLEKKRALQIASGRPPRYDRTCLNLTNEQIDQKIAATKPFVWRFKYDHAQTITIQDISRGPITFELKNFSDFPITRTNGTFTFMFANCVDDIDMEMTHVFRGEDHLSNTAGQAALYYALGKTPPLFWHMPILCGVGGKKMSKRDADFSLQDLKDEGFAPEAIVNYLATLGGSFTQEIMTLSELAQAIPFDKQQASAPIRHNPDKLRWMNRQWIERYSDADLLAACRPFLEEAHPQTQQMDDIQLLPLLKCVKGDLATFADVGPMLQFYFAPQLPTAVTLKEHGLGAKQSTLAGIIRSHLDDLATPSDFINALKGEVKEKDMKLKELYQLLRLALTGSIQGPSIIDVITALGAEESRRRIVATLDLLT